MDEALNYALDAGAQALGVEPATMAVVIPLVVLGLNLLGRAIPDDATGWKGVVRKIAKLGGLYLSNRISSGVSVNQVTKVVAGLEPKQVLPVEIPVVMEDELEPVEPEPKIEPMFPGFRRLDNGAFRQEDDSDAR